jgi:hypothetical protein
VGVSVVKTASKAEKQAAAETLAANLELKAHSVSMEPSLLSEALKKKGAASNLIAALNEKKTGRWSAPVDGMLSGMQKQAKTLMCDLYNIEGLSQVPELQKKRDSLNVLSKHDKVRDEQAKKVLEISLKALRTQSTIGAPMESQVCSVLDDLRGAGTLPLAYVDRDIRNMQDALSDIGKDLHTMRLRNLIEEAKFTHTGTSHPEEARLDASSDKILAARLSAETLSLNLDVLGLVMAYAISYRKLSDDDLLKVARKQLNKIAGTAQTVTAIADEREKFEEQIADKASDASTFADGLMRIIPQLNAVNKPKLEAKIKGVIADIKENSPGSLLPNVDPFGKNLDDAVDSLSNLYQFAVQSLKSQRPRT